MLSHVIEFPGWSNASRIRADRFSLRRLAATSARLNQLFVQNNGNGSHVVFSLSRSLESTVDDLEVGRFVERFTALFEPPRHPLAQRGQIHFRRPEAAVALARVVE